MTGLLASSRFRRRAAWVGVCLAVAGAVAFLGIRFSNTGHRFEDTFTPGKATLVPAAPKSDPFTRAEQRQVRAIAVRFIESAVYRRNVRASFALTTSGLRQGESRADWASGTIPVVPYPAEAVQTVRWRLDHSFANEVGLKVAFYPKPEAGIARQIFDITLENHGTAVAPKWLVSYWAPSGGAQISAADPRAPSIETDTPKPALGAAWLFVPIGVIVGGLVGVVVFLVVRGRIRRTRAERTARLYRSSSSPS
ncbi:MAG TPA: hypothetical protein VFB35_06035 [Gaiellaceae bacterium]|nr:hypothetical protein [Gaiellaceae bacterium]